MKRKLYFVFALFIVISLVISSCGGDDDKDSSSSISEKEEKQMLEKTCELMMNCKDSYYYGHFQSEEQCMQTLGAYDNNEAEDDCLEWDADAVKKCKNCFEKATCDSFFQGEDAYCAKSCDDLCKKYKEDKETPDDVGGTCKAGDTKCSGDYLSVCGENGKWQEPVDCKILGENMECSEVFEGYYSCQSKSLGTCSSGDMPYCDGQTLKYCDGSNWRELQCDSYGMKCAYDPTSQVYNCVQ